eukprot:1157367-Pelagomonas_calceolata.AAC.2
MRLWHVCAQSSTVLGLTPLGFAESYSPQLCVKRPRFRKAWPEQCHGQKHGQNRRTVTSPHRNVFVCAQVGDEGAVEVARHSEADAVVTGIVGCAGLLPTVAAIKAKKEICLANKETLIAGGWICSESRACGPFVLPLAKEYGVNILPADSEHSAIFQCLQRHLPVLAGVRVCVGVSRGKGGRGGRHAGC